VTSLCRPLAFLGLAALVAAAPREGDPACRPLVFPVAAGAHAASEHESWRSFAHLLTADGEAYDVAVTIASDSPANRRSGGGNEWSTARVMPAEANLVDRTRRRMVYARRLERAAAGLAHAANERLDTGVGDWTLREDAPAVGGRPRAVRLHVTFGQTVLDLAQRSTKAAVAFDAAPGCGYAFTRLSARGTLSVGGVARAVSGDSWFEHEWSRGDAAARDAFDHFAIQFDDGRDLLLRVPREAGRDAASRATAVLVAGDGAVRRFALGDASVSDALDTKFTSPFSGVRYDSLWGIGVPSAGIDLVAVPPVQDLEVPDSDLSGGAYMGPIDVERRPLPEGQRGHGFVLLARHR
jgi:predicted secreted hydrolase